MKADHRRRRSQARVATLAASLAALALVGACAAVPASAQVSFTRAWGWGVLDGKSQFETCTTTCQSGLGGGGAGQLGDPDGGVAVDGSGDVFVADYVRARVQEFSSGGAFIKAWGWGVSDGASQYETCTTTCEAGIAGGGAGQLRGPDGVAVDGSGDVFISDDYGNARVDEFSSAGAFTQAWGWGVLDGKAQLQTCTLTCASGLAGGGAGELDSPAAVAVDGSGDVFVAEVQSARVDEFSSAGAFVKAWGWGVADGKSQLETCTTTCQTGLNGGGAGELDTPTGVAVDGSGDVFVDEAAADRVDEFSSAGTFVKAWGWGVVDGKSQFETCTTTCQIGLGGGGAGELDEPTGVAVDGLGDVFVVDHSNRVDEFSSTGAFIEAWGWGVADGRSQFETCTTTCQSGVAGAGAGQLDGSTGVAVGDTGDVFVTDSANARVDEFGTAPLPQYTLAVSLGGTGSGSVTSSPAGISCPGACSNQFHSASQVTLSAAPGLGSTFAGWSGAGCSGTATCVVTMSAAEHVTATFTAAAPAKASCTLVPRSKRVTVKKHKHAAPKAGPGTITLIATCSASARASVKGTVTEHLAKKSGKPRTKLFHLATAHVALVGGVPKLVVMKVPASVVRALRGGTPESAAFTMTVSTAAGTVRATATIAALRR